MLLYKLINNLLYFNDSNPSRELRLYILIKILEQEIFKLIYNQISYSKYTRTYKKLTSDIYIFNISIKLYKYLRYYSHY